ncbi:MULTISPECIES: diguanylate cyclase [Shewanella]|uniref:sensor domain-containing diguanylate cyclase n=1 Tax=Shewanella TaxID=22 RepID=UPI000C5B5ED0|nr:MULTISPECIES: diguanylate cyclase [Shewanella]NCQ46915.1 diguanylate cyclase [Shewanella frigidimarina]NCO73239.1 diguanylate cyclase [Shewanella vesiculosa]NCP38286.1 diguanylate cyclase [Shewanella vesiculosa]NCP71663.1 diguanylate cyclase [Shewanella vesiculosa]NCP76019.1 diguanylate cyclase [Shewanella vesiculosa]
MSIKYRCLTLYNQYHVRIIVGLFLLLISQSSWSNTLYPTPLRLTANSITKIELQDWVYANQSNDIETLSQLLQQPENSWKKLNTDQPYKIGVKNYWVSFSIFTPNDHLARIIALDNPLLDSIKIYHLINGELVSTEVMGDTLPFKQRPLQSNIFLYPVNFEPGDTHTFYLKIDNKGTISLPLILWSSNDLTQLTETKNLFSGMQIGVLLAICLFSLFIALASASFSYSYYSGYVLGLTILSASIHGVSFRYLWPQWPIMQQYIFIIVIPLTLGFSLMFTEKVLQLKYHNLKMLRICRIMAVLSFGLTIVMPFINYSSALYVLVFVVLTISTILMAFSLIQAFGGQRNAPLYAIGRMGFMLGCIVTGLIYLGLISTNISPQIPIMLGLTFEVITMAAVLALRYNDERKAKFEIQQHTLEQAQKLRETREEALRSEAENSEKLEKMVQERTLELEITLRELSEVNQKLTEQNTIDSLTGVKNRSAFDRRLIAEGRISRRQQTPMSLLMIDIDKFKNINDKYGHLGGDHTIRAIANTLSEYVKRPTDLVSRFGGEEFAIILPCTDIEGALLVAEQIRQAVSELNIVHNEDTIPVTVSIGISETIIDSDEHPMLLLEQADKALYQAKRSGRNQVCYYQRETDTI